MGNASCWVCDEDKHKHGEGRKYYEEKFGDAQKKLPNLDEIRDAAEAQDLAMRQELLPLGAPVPTSATNNKTDFTKPIDLDELRAQARSSMRSSIKGAAGEKAGMSKRKSAKFAVGFSAEAPEPATAPAATAAPLAALTAAAGAGAGGDEFKQQRKRLQSMDILSAESGHEEMKRQLGSALEWLAEHAPDYHTKIGEHKKHMTAEEVWEKLKRGNERFEIGSLRRSSFLIRIAMESSGFKRNNLTAGQAPHACVLACADSRLPLSLIFNQGLGDLFEIRVAGNVIGHNELGSIEYAVSKLGVRLIVVLGHEFCGAVNASMTYDGPVHPLHEHEDTSESEAGNLPHILAKISPACVWAKAKRAQLDEQNDPANPLFHVKTLDLAIRKNVHNMATDILKRSKIIREYVKEHEVKLRMAEYRLTTGRVELISPEGIVEASDPAPLSPVPAASMKDVGRKSIIGRKSIVGAASQNAVIGGSSSELKVTSPSVDSQGKAIPADTQQDILSVNVAEELTLARRRTTVVDSPTGHHKGASSKGTIGRGTHKKQKSTRTNLAGAFES